MEERRVLSADPVIAGITYLEGDSGQDITPDHFEVTFQGGAATTQMTQFTINGDQDSSGTLSDGDMFFDVDSSLPGTAQFHPFIFDAANSSGITADDITGVTIGADGLSLTVNLQNFEAGDVLAFTIDVDEVERFRVDKIASGVEFEGSFFDTTFVDQNYFFEEMSVTTNVELEYGFVQPQQEGIFYDNYDQLFHEGESLVNSPLGLTLDNFNGQANRTAGTIDAYQLVPKPITISGKVYHDENLNCEFDADESGIANVEIQLQQLNASSGQYETVATTLTDASGRYEFGEELGLLPGDYQLVEVQPAGYLDVGASAGTVEGTATGDVLDGASGHNVISNIHVPLGGTSATNYDFKEVRPASISGTVWHDQNNDGQINNGEQGIANVLVQVTRIGAKPGVENDPFADTGTVQVRTDANGHYEVGLLPPGIYQVVEINNYPEGQNPLASYIDGKDSLGNVRGESVGSKSDDRFTEVELCADDHGVEYNFGELRPASVSGYVSVTTPGEAKLDPGDPGFEPIAGVEIQLYDSSGNLLDTTHTDDSGHYQFDGLRPGVYSIVEVQPNGYLDGGDIVGKVDGETNGVINSNDRFQNITLTSGDQGVRYDFCEIIPAELCGTVWHDTNDDGVIDAGEGRLGGVVVQLFDADGNSVAETRTDANGGYCFKDLYPGKYTVTEIQPASFADGKDSLGQIGGITVGDVLGNDSFCVDLAPGDQGVNYNFGEIRLASISGSVKADADGDKTTFKPENGDRVLADVEIVLLNAAGEEIARTTTDANGEYSFDGLRPGTYSVREIGPDGYLDGADSAGTVDGQRVGTTGNDLLSGIVLVSGSQGINYDFCEYIPAEICGTVYHDRNDNGVQDSGEEGIGNTRVVLYDAQGNVVAEARTDAEGAYCFTNLIAGEYCVKEFQPANFVDGKDTLGKIGSESIGTQRNDEFCNITIRGGQRGVQYNFGELKLAEISGNVHIDADGNCVFNPEAGDKPLADVMLELIDADGDVIATTMTDANGNYKFGNILPGEYSIRETQPDGLYNAGEKAGDAGGNVTENLITGILIQSGQKLTQYNFCEHEPAEIHGRVWEDGPAFETENGLVPAGYRNQRDGVFQAGVDTPIEGVRMRLYFYLDPANNAIAPRPVTLGEVMSEFYGHMGTDDPNAPVWVETSASGEYSFLGLQAGNYIVLETQPEGYVDANDIPGSTRGLVFNSDVSVAGANAALRVFSGAQLMDSVTNIRINAGGLSTANDFTEVRVQTLIPPPVDPPGGFTPPDNVPTPSSNPRTPLPGLTSLPGLAGAQPSSFQAFVGTSSALNTQGQAGGLADPYTWHLSVVNAGAPRAVAEAHEQEGAVWQQVGYLNNSDWQRFDMTEATWSFTTTRADGEISEIERTLRFGMLDGIAVAGDFDGDGTDEVAVFKDGYWMIDINRNGRWEESDLLAKLGEKGDRPVVGDWDGDGKDDIGIYGPMWARDQEAIDREPGLPNPENSPFTKPKNVPPVDEDSTSGARIMKLTSYGRQRADVIDHVFGTGERRDIPVAGDWNGNGIRSIGKFQDGIWQLDVNGDGEFDQNDITAHFGRAGDIPVVGDFNGDGIEEIAVYRSGSWIIDSNGNRELDATDKTFEMGGANDQPVVGDWDGDGLDEPGLYRQSRNAG
jgi:protocatechuate 3,4-dioxygenase beta subunit